MLLERQVKKEEPMEETMLKEEATSTEATATETPSSESASDGSPEIQAAMFLHKALPTFRRQLESVTGVQAKHVLSALAEAPLEKTVPDFTTKEATELFNLGLMITNAKFILFNVALKDKEITSSVEAAAKEAGAAEASAAEVSESKGESNVS